jgi:hypothetical protein
MHVISLRRLRFHVVNNHSIIVTAGEYFRIITVEAEAKDVAQVLFVHGTRFALVGQGLFHVP